MKVADVMSKHVDYVSEDTKVEKLSLLIFGRGINGVPVCRNKKVVGFVTERDILSKFYPTISEYVDDPFRSSDFEGMEAKVKEIFELNAGQIMSQNTVTVTTDTPLLRAQSLMFIEKVGRLPVVDGKGNLVGIIAKGDIFRSLVGDKLLFTEDEDYNDWLSKTYYASVDTENRLKHEMPDFLKLFKENNVKSVLDIGCGTGDHVIEFAREGFMAAGVDRSRGMIAECNRKRQLASEEVKKRFKFHYGDFEDKLSDFKEKFDVAIFTGNTIPHNPYRYKEVIRKTADVLSENGIMFFQITNFEKIHKELKLSQAMVNSRPDHFDLEYEKKIKKMLSSENHQIIQSHLAGFDAQGIQGVFKILVVCEDSQGNDKEEIRIDRLINRDKISIEDAKEEVLEREKQHLEKWRRLYVNNDQNWVYWDKKYYDLVVSTYSHNQAETLKIALEAIGYTA